MQTLKFAPFIPATVKASWKGTQIFLVGPNSDVERAATALLSLGVATARTDDTLIGGEIFEGKGDFIDCENKQITLTFYKKKLLNAINESAGNGYPEVDGNTIKLEWPEFALFSPSGEITCKPIRKKKDGRKFKSILNWNKLQGRKYLTHEDYTKARRARIIAQLAQITEVLSSKDEHDGKIGRGMDALLSN